MGLISATKRIAVEMLKTMDDATKQNLVLPLNSLNEQVVNTINGQLNFGDNLTSKVSTQKLSHNVMLVVSNPIGNLKARGITAIDCSHIDGVKNIYITPQPIQSQIGITAAFNTPGVTAQVAFIVWAG
ncbi:MAG: hypothetical protein V4563_16955 [Pseudomonadota bacterium]